MRLLIVSCSKNAYELGERLREEWEQAEPSLCAEHIVKTRMLPEFSLEGKMEPYVQEHFTEYDVILFLCAAGIAVRAIAPVVRHKSLDPAVLVMDEKAKHCISLLSGHAGGANHYTQIVSALCDADPVITTASDLEEKFAVDLFARENGLLVANWKTAKWITVKILSGEPIGLCSDEPFEGELPEELVLLNGRREEEMKEESIQFNGQSKDGLPEISSSFNEQDEGGFSERAVSFIGQDESMYIHITDRKESAGNERCLKLIVPDLVLGIGCRKDTPLETIEEAVSTFLKENGYDRRAVSEMASVDLKAEEPGILAFSEKHRIPFRTFAAEELAALEGEFSESEFVEKVTGVSGVCERAAVMAGGKLIVKKTCYPKVTLALAKKSFSIHF